MYNGKIMQNGIIFNTKYLIIGNSAGGIAASEAIRKIDKTGQITIVTDEPYIAYSRPCISKILSGERSIEGIYFRKSSFYTDNNICFLPNKTATYLDPPKNIAHLDDGTMISWDKVLIATGGRPIIPEIKGIQKKNVFTFTKIADAMAILEYIKHDQKTKRAVVIGGGLIGLSISEALTKLGLQVTIIEIKDRILNTIVDETASRILTKAILDKGITVITSSSVKEIKGGSKAQAVILENGVLLPCDIVVLSIGVSPRIELAKSANLKINKGIIVDQYMQTSNPCIYACGDVSEYTDFIRNSFQVIPVWPNAYIGGLIAGYNMCGIKIEHPPLTTVNSLNYFGVDIITAGIINSDLTNDIEIKACEDNNTYKKIILRDNKIIGLLLVNDIEKAGIYYGLMKAMVDVTAFSNKLLANDFGLLQLPDDIRNSILSSKFDNINLYVNNLAPANI